MARDINKLKDRLHAVKGLDSSSMYNAQDEEEKKKKQAAQLKSDAQINAARQAGEQARLSAIEKNKKILRENREANVQARKQATAKSNANRAVSPGIEDTISRKQQLTDAMVQLRDWGSGKGDKWQSNNDFQTAYNAYENAMSWAEQSEAAGDIDAAKYMREAASYLAKWGNIAGTELTKLTDQYGSFENAEAYRNGDRSGYREYLNRDKSWEEIDSHIKELEKTIESTSDLKRRSEYQEELDWYNNYARNNYTEAAETELDLLRRKQDTLQNALAQSEINNSPLNGTPVDDDEKSEILKRFDEDIEAAKAANMDPWYISALEKARESFVADASPVSYEQNWQDIDRYDELSGRIGGLNDQIASAEQSLEMAKTADWERNNRIKYAALEQEMNAANWYFDNYDYENFKELVASEKARLAMQGMPDIYTIDVRDQYTKEEASIYMYLREKGRVEEADAFANYMQSTAAGRRNQQIEQRFAEEDIGIVGRTIVAVAANPGKIANTIDINLQKLGNVLGDEYIPIDYETTGNFGVASNVNREIATQELAALGTLNDALGVEIPYIGSYTLGDLYGTGVDYLNSAMNVALFGPGAAGTALAAEKFSDEYRAAKERGGTDNQAFNYAWGSSIAEGVGEQIVLDRYLGFLTKLGRNPGKAAAIMAGIISVAEGGVQEAATTAMENAVDKWTMGENSEFNIAVRRYEAMGYEHGTAEQMAIDEMNREILKSGIMGALGQGAPVAGGYAAQGISKAAGSVQTAIDDSARGRQIQKMDNAQQMAQLMGEVTGETVTPEKSKRKLGKQQREFIENAGEYVSGADEATRDIVRGKVYDVANASAEALDGTSQAAKEKAGKRSAAMKTSDTGASVGGESVTVQGFVKTAEKGSDAKLNIKKADGTLAEANMEDVTFDSKNSEVYSYAADMATPELANDFRMRIQPDQMGSIERVANGYSQAYDMARAGFKEASVRASSLTGALTDEQVSAAYKLGAEARKSAQIAAITKAAERAKANKDIDWKGGKASFDDSVVVDALDDTQKAQIDVASVFTGAMGVNVVFFESKADESGRYTRENGSYNRKTNTIYIDVNAGRYYKGDSPSKTALLRTLSHEVTHAVQRNSPEIYSELRDTVTDILGDAKDVTIEDLIDRKMAADSSLTTRDAAMDELVADACERMIEDSDAAQRLAEAHPEAAKTIFQKVGELLTKLKEAIKAAFKGRQLSTEAQLVMKDVERYQKMVDLWTKGVMQTAEVSGREYATGAEDTVENTEAFLDSEEAIQNQARPPYTDKTKACTAFVESLNEEARATYDLLYNFYQASRLGRQNLSSKFMYYSDWNAMVAKDPRWAERAQAMADSIPAAVREKMRMNDDGTLNPNSLETEFKMNRSMGQRIIDALETEVIDTKYVIDGIEYRLSKGNATTAVGGEAYRRAVCEETRKAYRDGTLKQASIGTLSKDKWGSLGFLATNGKTGASGDFTTLCPQMFYNKGCHYCYRLSALTTGVNNKLVGANVWYGGEILRIKDADIDMLNRNGGLRIQSFGDWMPQFSSQLADMLYDADMRGLQIKIITKEPSMIEYVALLREQGLGKSLYFNLSADYAIERAGNRETADYTTMNTTRPYMRDAQGDLWWKRAMTVQEANKYRQKYPWVNTRIVATTQEEFLRGLRDSTVDVVTGYHGNIREWERIDSEDGKVVVNVEALGDAGMPRFSYDAANNEWSIEYEGKTATHKALAHAIADAGLQYEYYVKTCCITGRCATCEGKCGRLAKDFNIKNATNRDGESVAYWQQQMEYDEAGEQTMEYDDVQFQVRVTDPNTLDFLDNQETVTTYKTMQVVNGELYPPMAAVVAGSYEDASELGTWEQATEHPELIKLDKKGKPQFVLNKGQGKGNVPAAYNPYMHSSNLVLNDQFSSAYNRPNLVTVECEVPVSELTSGYRAQYAKDAVGWHSWHTGTVAGALRKATGMERQVLLSRWIKPVRIVPDAEVARMYKDLLDGTGVTVPDNVVPPGLLTELEKIGVPITESGKVSREDVQFQTRDPHAISDREILANALESAAQTDDERIRLAAYKEGLAKLNSYQAVLDENKAVIGQLAFKKGRTSEENDRLTRAKNRVKMINEKLDEADRALLKLEAMDPIKAIITREGKKVRDERNAVMRERISDMKQTHENAAARKSIGRKVKRLNDMLINATDQRHIPEEFKYAVKDMLELFTNDTSVFDKDRLERVRTAYAAIEASKTDAASMYDDDIAYEIESLATTIGGRRLAKLNANELQMVRNILDHFAKMVKDANNVFLDGRRASIDALSFEVEEQTSGKQHMENRLTEAKFRKWLTEGQIIPPYFFKNLGGAMGRLGDAILAGEDNYGIEVRAAKARLQELMRKFNHRKWANRKNDTLELVTESGDAITLTREQALGLYAAHKREVTNKDQNAHHLSEAGIVFRNQVKDLHLFKKTFRNSNAVPISGKDMEAVMDWLTEEQMQYADAMVEYISTEMAVLGNETSMQLHGYRKFNEGFYYPYKVPSDFLKTDYSKTEDALIKNMGFTKRTQRGASNPLVVTDFTKTVADHVNRMLLYHNFAVPQDSFMRVFDHHISKRKTVRSALDTAYGERIGSYIDQLMKDMHGGVGRDNTEDIANQWLGKFKKAKVMASLSVAVQQPSSIGRAFALVNVKYFRPVHAKGAFDEAMQYAGTAVIKSIGRFDTNTGSNVVDWMTREGFDGVMDFVDTAGGFLPEQMDMISWGTIWDAVKREQADKTGLDIDSEELKKIAGKRFNEVIRFTQVYDSTLVRSQTMRSKSVWTKMATSFMSEATVTYNMVYDALQNITKEPRKAAATFAAVAGSIIANALLKSIVTAARDDDDEEATYKELYIKNLMADLINGFAPMTYVPLASDIWSIAQGFTVERTDLEVFNLAKEFKDIMQNENASTEKKIRTAASFISMVSGIPISNVWREVDAIKNTITAVQNTERPAWFETAIKRGLSDGVILSYFFDDSKAANVDKLYKEARTGSKDAAETREHLILYNNVKDDKAVDSLLRTRIKDGFTAGEIGADEAIEMLTGYAGMKQEDASDKVLEWQYAIDNDGSSYSDMRERYLEGEISYDDAVSDRVQYGGVESDKAKATVDKWEFERLNGYAYEDLREEHADGNVSSAEAMEIMQDYGGKDENEAYWEVTEWDYGDGWDGKGTLLNDAFAAGSDAQVRSRMQELAGHSDWQKPGNELASYVTDFYKPIYEAAPAAQKDALRQTILGYLKMAYEAVGEEYYGDDYALRYRSWLKK